jgi:hypothetical protein
MLLRHQAQPCQAAKVSPENASSSVKIDIVALRIEALPHTYVLYLIDFSSQLFPLRDAESLPGHINPTAASAEAPTSLHGGNSNLSTA